MRQGARCRTVWLLIRSCLGDGQLGTTAVNGAGIALQILIRDIRLQEVGASPSADFVFDA
jgi:hypothetical protein